VPEKTKAKLSTRRAIASIVAADPSWGSPVRHFLDRFEPCDWCGAPGWEPDDVLQGGEEIIEPGECPRCALLVAYAIGWEQGSRYAKRVEDEVHRRDRPHSAKGRSESEKAIAQDRETVRDLRRLPDAALERTRGRSNAARKARGELKASLGLASENADLAGLFNAERRRRRNSRR